MLLRSVARVLGVVVALLAVVGLFVEGEHLLGFMNVDLALDIIRIVVAAALLIAGFARGVPLRSVRAILGVVGAMYIVMGLIAIADRELAGLLPTGFTAFDIAFHLIVGVATLVVALAPARVVERADARPAPRD